MSFSYGIDFGTTNSSISAMRFNARLKGTVPHTFRIEPNGSPDTVMKSVVTIAPDGTIYVGQQATRAGAALPGAVTFTSIKSVFAQRNWSETVGGRRYSAAMIASFILKELKARADRESGTWGSGAIMGVPVGFTDLQKETLQQAAILAGIVPDAETAAEQIRFVAEPVAVATNYGFEVQSDRRVLVFDFGGGTLDLTIMDMRYVRLGELQEREVLAKKGVKLGGDDVDHLVLRNLVAAAYGEQRLLRELGLADWAGVTRTSTGLRLMEEVERRKRDLSSAPDTAFSFYEGGLNINLRLTREALTRELQPMLGQIRDILRQTLLSADQGRRPLRPSDIDTVIMAGGSSLIPAVQDVLREIFGPDRVQVHDNPLTSIAEGLAQISELPVEDHFALSDITDCHYGVWDEKNANVSVIIPSGTPYRETQFNKANKRGIKRSYRLLDASSRELELQIYMVDKERTATLLHTALIPISPAPVEPGKARFDVYFSIDPLKGWLSFEVWDAYEADWLNVPTDSQVRIRW